MDKYKVNYYSYDQNKFPFEKIVKDLFDINELHDIHLILDNLNSNALFTNQNDDTTLIHSIFIIKTIL